MQYLFYYDETEHSRKINYQTITANNYYDNFISVIVGWSSNEEKSILDRYLAFESKYNYRKVDVELKSQTMSLKDFKLGFASLNKHKIDFYDELISLIDENMIIYFAVASKIEYVIQQIFANYHNSLFMDVDFMKYSIIKAINVYRPQNVIEAIYKEPQVFVKELRGFLEKQIKKNKSNMLLKEHENQAFEEILMLLDDTQVPKSLDWTYFMSFDGFKKLLDEMNVSDYNLTLDREGDESHTFASARYIGLKNVTEEDSKECVGIRMADMLAGLISRMMQSLKISLVGDYKDGEIKKTLLDSGWFALNQRQLNLYKKLYQVICINNNYWYKSYVGLYFDDLVAFVSLLQFMNHFESVEEIRNDLEMQPEYYNCFVCEELQKRYNIIQNKLPIEPIVDDGSDHFYNRRGAKVNYNIELQSMLPLHEGQNIFNVLSVGFEKSGVPLVTILVHERPMCYRLPSEYKEWVMILVGMANVGEKIFPNEVMFSVVAGKYYANLL